MCFGSQPSQPAPDASATAPAVDPPAQAQATADAAANSAKRKQLGLGDVQGTLLATSAPTGQPLGNSQTGATVLGSTA